jgi:hypothetical protein
MNGWPVLSGKFGAILSGESNWQLSRRANLRKKVGVIAGIEILPKS